MRSSLPPPARLRGRVPSGSRRGNDDPRRDRRDRQRQLAADEAIGTLTVAAVVPLLNPTTASLPVVEVDARDDEHGVLRVAHDASRPVASSGCASRSVGEHPQLGLDRVVVTSNDEPLPIGGEPTRCCVCQSATWVGNMSWRASWSPPRADHPDLVAVVDRRRAAQQVEQVVAEQHVLGRSVARRARAPASGSARGAAHVVVAEEGRERRVDAVRRPEVVVVGEPVGDAARAGRAGGVGRRRPPGTGSRAPAAGRGRGRTPTGRRHRSSVTSPKIGKSLMPAARAAARIFGTQSRKKAALTCFAVSTRKPSTLKLRDPDRVDLREPVQHVRLLGEEVVEPEEVALLEARPGCTSRSRCCRGRGS